MDYGTIAFQNTHAAMTTQSYLSKRFSISVMPTLRKISMSCGISIRFQAQDLQEIQQAMEAFDLDRDAYAIYAVTHQGKDMLVEEIK